MEKEYMYVTRYVTKDGNKRVTICYDEYADSPRYTTDEPLHCEDWSRDYSIMNKYERETKSRSARLLLEYMINNYGDYKKIIDALVDNGKNIGNKKVSCGTALLYDKSRKAWLLVGDINCYFGSEREDGWYEYNVLDGKKYDLDICEITEEATDDAIDYLVTNCMTDKVKIMSYGFGYNGDISFYNEVSTDSEGICWLEKDEFLKYGGHKEEYWNGKTLDEIEWLLDELEAWSEGEVYGFKVEERIVSKIYKEYTNVERDDEVYEEEEWEETDSCWGFYGELSKSIDYIIDCAGFKKDELIEKL